MAIVKNMAKDGRYYWVVTEFEPKVDALSNEIKGYTAFRRAAPQKAIDAITPIYAKLLEIEAEGGMESSEKYFKGFLEEQGKSYDQFIDELVGNKGVFKLFFTAMKKLFG